MNIMSTHISIIHWQTRPHRYTCEWLLDKHILLLCAYISVDYYTYLLEKLKQAFLEAIC